MLSKAFKHCNPERNYEVIKGKMHKRSSCIDCKCTGSVQQII